jgi:hypothetical protein
MGGLNKTGKAVLLNIIIAITCVITGFHLAKHDYLSPQASTVSNDDTMLLQPPKVDTTKLSVQDYLLFYLHIPKCGGTSFSEYLTQNLTTKIHSLEECHVTKLENKGFPGQNSFQDDLNKIIDRRSRRATCSLLHKESALPYLRSLRRETSTQVLGATLFREPMASILSAVGHDVLLRQRYNTTAAAQRIKNYKTCLEQPFYRSQGRCITDKGYNLFNRQFIYFNNEHPFSFTPNKDSSPTWSVTSTIQAIDTELFFIGITDHMHASQCLLEYQLGVFDPVKCAVQCRDEGRYAHLMGDAANKANAADRPSSFSLSLDVLEAMQSLIKQDIIVYAHVVDVFWKRVKWIEREYSVKLICEHFPVSLTV